jgi:hypothetical protein
VDAWQLSKSRAASKTATSLPETLTTYHAAIVALHPWHLGKPPVVFFSDGSDGIKPANVTRKGSVEGFPFSDFICCLTYWSATAFHAVLRVQSSLT